VANVKMIALSARQKGPARAEAMGNTQTHHPLVGMMGAGKSSVAAAWRPGLMCRFMIQT